MSENKNWLQDKPARNWGFIWGILIGVFVGVTVEILKFFIEHSTEFQQNYPNLYEFLKWFLIILPWLALIFVLYFYFWWKYKANTLIQSQSKWDGIEQITGLDRFIPKLEGSGHHPRELLGKIERKLDFMGHGARKWTANKSKLADMLSNISFNDKTGKVRFLVINPLLEKDPKNKKTGAESLWTLWKLQKEHNNIEVKIYEHIPQLRLTFYDDDVVVVGHYQGKDQKRSDDTPLLVFQRKCEWSFYKGFLSHFEEEFDRAIPLDDTFMKKIEDLL